jgi:hypothetical protein
LFSPAVAAVLACCSGVGCVVVAAGFAAAGDVVVVAGEVPTLWVEFRSSIAANEVAVFEGSGCGGGGLVELLAPEPGSTSMFSLHHLGTRSCASRSPGAAITGAFGRYLVHLPRLFWIAPSSSSHHRAWVATGTAVYGSRLSALIFDTHALQAL